MVECTQRQVSGFASDLQDQAIGKHQRRLLAITIQRGGDRTGILHDQVLVIQKHLNRRGELPRYETVNRGQYPGGMDEHDVRRGVVANSARCTSWDV